MKIRGSDQPTIAEMEEIPSFSSEFLDYMERRGISEEIYTKAGLHVATSGPYTGCLVIPYPNRTGIWKNRYRRISEGDGPKYMDEPGATNHLYNPQRLGAEATEVWFTEGELDALTLWQYGLPAIGLPGASIAKTEVFAKAWALLWRGADIYLFMDNDHAGMDAVDTLQHHFGRVKTVWGPDGMDINDLHCKEPETLRSLIEQARIDG